jgi:hypothetical protein
MNGAMMHGGMIGHGGLIGEHGLIGWRRVSEGHPYTITLRRDYEWHQKPPSILV